ncbi:MAG: superoxide dismutase [Brevinema sp.]
MYVLPQLDYRYNALEPQIDAKTMEIHHSKHHQAYVDNLNNALKVADPKLSLMTLESLLAKPKRLPEAVRNNAGGHYNHSFFWKILGKAAAPAAPAGTPAARRNTTVIVVGGLGPKGQLLVDIDKQFGSFTNFQAEFEKAAMSRFGSGWAWLVKKGNTLSIITTANQDTPLAAKYTPILALDVWEHAYYLKYENRRAEYVKGFWSVINWDYVEALYEETLK